MTAAEFVCICHVADSRINIPVDIRTGRTIEMIEDAPRRHRDIVSIVCCKTQRTPVVHHLSFIRFIYILLYLVDE